MAVPDSLDEAIMAARVTLLVEATTVVMLADMRVENFTAATRSMAVAGSMVEASTVADAGND
jgi:hypothetical protein